MEHSRIGASSAHRWMECPGSVGLSKLAPPQASNIYAEQGTAAAWVLEQCIKAWKASDKLLQDHRADEYVGLAAPNGYEITDEDAESVQKCLDALDETLATGKFVVYEEAKFDLSSIYPGLFGTSDIVLMESNMKRLIVIDYKHGSGIPVAVEDNEQLLYYALGAIKYVCDKEHIDYLDTMGWGHVFTTVEVRIVQPRCRHKDGAHRSWVVPAESLDAFAVALKAAAELTDKEDAAFKTGDHCRFCPALSICQAFNNQTFELAQADFKGTSDPKNLHLPEPEALNKGEISKILRFADMISAFLKAVESHAQTLLEHGEEIEGWKLVQKKSNRQWRDEEEAQQALGMFVPESDLYERKFLSPAKAEKMLGKDKKKIVEGLTVKPDTGNTLAPEHDPREAVKGSVLSDFTATTK